MEPCSACEEKGLSHIETGKENHCNNPQGLFLLQSCVTLKTAPPT